MTKKSYYKQAASYHCQSVSVSSINLWRRAPRVGAVRGSGCCSVTPPPGYSQRIHRALEGQVDILLVRVVECTWLTAR